MFERLRGPRPLSPSCFLALLAMLSLAAVAPATAQTASGAAAGPAAASGAPTAPPTVLVTGANRGIGLALARQYATRGWTVIATARDLAAAAELRELAARHPDRIVLETLDVTDHAGVDALAKRLAGRPIDLLLHNAGVSGGPEKQMFGRLDYQAFRDTLEVNTLGPMKVTEALVANVLAGSQKKIVLIGTSEAWFRSINAGRMYWYRGSKAAAHMLMLNLAFELKPKGVTVGVINPGPVATDMMKGLRMPMQSPDESVAKVIGIIDRLELANTGKFWDYERGEQPW